ncbi:substrate-binding domain-containing protein [Conexibacter sp. CPCC 206217]|uniref:sugar ABC transporter substrate-binding protein n=1 Tax=Conexibacter sp. CPCC 206217 TaxID=3064574 RepID=UPI0027159143|nr:substrate-binding domain-containing protein [Conexibacter sp. CPCC 206217]MDO8211649.1 substrate-binding domain-containing protein [Conexibacter sp. CPCC 206217]
MSRITERSRAAAGLALGIGMLAFVAGCGGESSSSSSTSTPAATAQTPAATDAASTTTAAASDGNNTLCVTSNVSFGLAPLFFEGYKEIAKQYGLDYVQKIASPDGNLQSAATNIQQCINAKPKAIVGIATESAAVAAPIAAAEKAGIPYIADQSGSPVPGVRVQIWGNEYANSAALVGYLLTSSDRPQNIYVLRASALPVVARRTAGLLAALPIERTQLKLAGSSELDLADVARSATEKTLAAVRANKDVNVVVAPWDDPAAGALAALKQLNRDDVKIITYDGLDSTYETMRGGERRIAAIAALPAEAFFNVRKLLVGQILDGSLPPSVNALCSGPLVTPDSIPAKGELTPGGSCILNGRVETADELRAAADAELARQ